MPNWCFNYVKITGDKKKIDEVVQNFNFQKIIPMPEELHIVSGTVSDLAVKYYQDKTAFEKDEVYMERCKNMGIVKGERSEDISYLFKGDESPLTMGDLYELGSIIESNKAKYGAPDWYEWSCKNWGTKWNAGDVTKDDIENGFSYEFDTAWCMPKGIFIEIAKRLPDCEIEWAFEIEGEWDGEGNRPIHKIIYKNGMVGCDEPEMSLKDFEAM